jgi:hypothetical protein
MALAFSEALRALTRGGASYLGTSRAMPSILAKAKCPLSP